MKLIVQLFSLGLLFTCHAVARDLLAEIQFDAPADMDAILLSETGEGEVRITLAKAVSPLPVAGKMKSAFSFKTVMGIETNGKQLRPSMGGEVLSFSFEKKVNVGSVNQLDWGILDLRSHKGVSSLLVSISDGRIFLEVIRLKDGKEVRQVGPTKKRPALDNPVTMKLEVSGSLVHSYPSIHKAKPKDEAGDAE